MNKNFLGEDYLLDSDSAKVIYDHIKDMPIFDYHSHLSSREIYEDKPYNDLAEIWLACDHYKWRLMREAGVDEKYITGNATGEEKFKEFARILPLFVGNPVYEWAHMELKRYFDISLPINATNADSIWTKTKQVIAEERYSPRKLLKMAMVDTVMTTDDPVDSLEWHAKLRESGFDIRVIPTFRPDKVLNIQKQDFTEYIHSLQEASGVKILDIQSMLKALANRLDYFVQNRSTIADVSVIDIPANGDKEIAAKAFDKALAGGELTSSDIDNYVYYTLGEIAKMFSERDIVMQVHIGAIRNQNTRRYESLGVDSGIDSIADVMNVAHLGRWMDMLDKQKALPRSIYYSHNDSVYYPLSAMINNFAGEVKGKVQLGAAWWMNDSREGMLRQLEAFKNTCGLGYFNGMLTDSRSFTSFVRHDYFRRVLSSLLGNMAEDGTVLLDQDLINMAKNIAYYNAKQFFSREEK